MELALGIGLLLVLFLTGGSDEEEEEEGERNLGPTPWTPDSTVPGRKRKGPDGKGDAWVEPARYDDLPGFDTFDWDGNGLYIDPNCELVAEGDLFWQGDEFAITAIPRPTLGQTLAIEGNSVAGYIDYMVDEEGEDDPIEVVWRILEEASPMCAAVEPEQWGEAMRVWFNDFLDRVADYMGEPVIPFGE